MSKHTAENLIRLVLLEDHGLFRASLGRFLASEPGFDVVSECGKSTDALDILTGSSVDVVLLDFSLGSERADEFMSAAHRSGYQGRFLIVAGTADARSSAVALKLGASGIFLKSEAPERLEHAIRVVADGDIWLDQRVIQILANQLLDWHRQLGNGPSEDLLTDRENKVLQGIVGGLTNKKIGDNIGLSEGSIKAVVQKLFYRAGVRTRSQLVRMALEGSLGAPTELAKLRRNAKLTARLLDRRAPHPRAAGKRAANSRSQD